MVSVEAKTQSFNATKPAQPESIIGSVQTDTPVSQYTESQLAYQRQLLREKRGERVAGDGRKSAVINTAMLAGSTAVDIVKANVAEAVFRGRTRDNKNKSIRAYIQNKDPSQEKKLENATRRDMALYYGADLAEEWATDSLYKMGANAWLSYMTGVQGAEYATKTSEFLCDVVNITFQAFLDDQLIGWRSSKDTARTVGGVKTAYKSYDLVNPNNTEAVIRLLEEIPVFGDGVSWLHNRTDKILTSVWGKWSNTFMLSKFLLGVHIGKNAWFSGLKKGMEKS